MDVHNLADFFRLSAQLNLQLSATAVGRNNIVAIILGHMRSTNGSVDRDVLLKALEYLDAAYGERRRRVGPLAVLHPLRAAALLVQVSEHPTTLDILTEFLHDKLEDITERTVGATRHTELEERFQALLEAVDPSDEWYLMERLEWLTRGPDEGYYRYVGRLLQNADRAPSLVAVKLADRLDNTLDMRIAVEDPIEGFDFFGMIFQTLFVNNFCGYVPDLPHPPASPLRGAQRLYELYKNAVLLSLLRKQEIDLGGSGAETLFNDLAIASMVEAERTALHIFGYHLAEVGPQRQLLMDVMEYVQAGGAERVTRPNATSQLDGLFETRFDDTDPTTRTTKLDELNKDKPMIAQASIAFIVIFQSFLQDPAYYLDGVSEEGIRPR